MTRPSERETAARPTAPDRRATEASQRATFDQLPVGTALGRYVILELRGYGGMGVVYAAYDPKLDRRVALKLVRHVDDEPGGDARLLREAQAMAKLAHPNVVTVHDAAIIGDAVCIEMEFVDGVTLDDWTTGRSWREVLDVYLQAGGALAAAHAVGLVHRDFKPSNAIVDATGRVRVLDFGLARAVADVAPEGDEERQALASTREEIGTGAPSLPTLPRSMTGLSAGTPAFMPPEQWRGKPVDGRADQYAFAASLFEALHGVLPFPRASYASMKSADARGKIAERPESNGVPAWIDRTLVRALAFEPERRFPSMEALLAALTVDPAASKRRAAVVVAAVAVAGVLGAIGIRYSSATDAKACLSSDRLEGVWDDSKKEAVKRAITRRGDPVALEAWSKTSAALDTYAATWVKMRTSTCEDGRKGRAASDSDIGARLVCLDARVRELRVLTDVLTGESDVVHESTTAARGLAPLSECAVASRRRSARSPEDPKLYEKADRLRGRIVEAETLRSAGRPKAARPIVTAAREEAKEAPLRAVEAAALLTLGRLEHDEGEYKLSAAALEQAVWAAESAGDDETLMAATTLLAFITGYRLNESAAADRWTKHAAAALERYGPSDEHAAELDRVRSAVARHRKELPAALELAKSSLAANIRARGPTDVRTAHSEMVLASAFLLLAKLDDAMTYLERAREHFESALGKSHPTCAGPIVNEAIVARRRGDYAGAIALYDRALGIYLPALGAHHPDTVLAANNRAFALVSAGRYEEAHATFARVLDDRRKIYGNNNANVASALTNLAWVARKLRRYTEAHARIDEAIAMHEKTGGAESASVAAPLLEKAKLALDEKKPRDALPLSERALELRVKGLGPDHPDVAVVRVVRGRAHIALGDPASAVDDLERAVAHSPNDSPRARADAELALALALDGAKRAPERALALARSAESVFAKEGDGAREDLAEARAIIASGAR